MVVSVLLATVLAAPPGLPKDPPSRPADRQLSFEAEAFGRQLLDLADRVSGEYVKLVDARDLLIAGLTELYAISGQKLPEDIRTKMLQGTGSSDYLRTLTEARVALGRRDEFAGWKSFVLAANGFSRATDPYSTLTWQKTNSAAASDCDFGMGFEMEGVTSARWVAYVLDSGSVAQIMSQERTEAFQPPVGPKWVVKRVFPGSPAAVAGMRPGDVITHLNSDEISPESNSQLFRKLASFTTPELNDGTPIDASRPVVVRVKRVGTPAPVDLSISRAGYVPESIYGVIRRIDGAWDYMLDREAKIGYIRLGTVEMPAAEAFAGALRTLASEGATGIVLDLRWCPGGYIDPTVRICGRILTEGTSLGTVKYRVKRATDVEEYFASAGQTGGSANLTLPIAVLVGCDTTGGGEMIAAALQDHKRAIIVGQRTFGKANLMNIVYTTIPGLTYRVSRGYSFRQNGKVRHRFPDSKPSDDWGVRPDRGFEVPTTPDYSAKLRTLAESQAIRPAGDLNIVAFDDPLEDPQKLLAVKFLKEQIAKK